MEHKFTPVPTSEEGPEQQNSACSGGGGFPEPCTQPHPLNSFYNYDYSQGHAIEMQPMMGSPHGYGPPGTGYPYQQPVSPLHNLAFLQPLTEIFLDEVSNELLLVHGDGRFILKVDKQRFAPRQQSGIGGDQTTFLTRSGQKIFACNREEFSSFVVAGEFALGDVEGDCCGCDRSFLIKSKTGGPNFNVTPTGAMAGAGCSLQLL